MPKYSIILPVYNAERYIRDSINSVLRSEYKDFEFIISNNCSTDDTESILKEIDDSRVKILKTDTILPLGAHWNFAIQHAIGEWVWCMGADDAIVPYFFELCDRLTDVCRKNNLNIIKSSRCYYFWPGCENDYGNQHVDFSINSNLQIKKTSVIMNQVLSGKALYVDLPQMYVSSMFSRKLIDKVISYSKTKEIIPYNVPAQDAYLGVLACVFEDKYLYTDIPLGWVGTSPSSLGYKVRSKQLLYKDCPYSILANKVLSMLFFLYLAFKAFEENSMYKTKKIKKWISCYDVLGRVYYLDLLNLHESNEKVQSFFSYLASINVDKKVIIKRAEIIKRMDLLYNIIKKSVFNKLFFLFERGIFFVCGMFKKKKTDSWRIIVNNDCFLTYEQINLLLNSEGHVRKIIDQINC